MYSSVVESSRQNKHKLQYSSASPLPALAFEEIHVLAALYNPFSTVLQSKIVERTATFNAGRSFNQMDCDSCYQPGWCAREELQWVKHLNPRIMDLRSIITVSSDSSGIQDQMVEVSQPCIISFIYQGLAFPLFEDPTEGLFVRNNNHGDRGLEIKFYDPANASGTRARRIMRQEFMILAAVNSTTFCFYKPPGSSQQALPLSSQSVSPQEHGLLLPPPPPPPSPPPSPPPPPPPPPLSLPALLPTPLPSLTAVSSETEDLSVAAAAITAVLSESDASLQPARAAEKAECYGSHLDAVFADMWKSCMHFVEDSDLD
ncbi:hypothetical protein BD769DRAFT_1397427 [Suillus cothurnatus]|nr:hypothetical protein BD769DRAFT_1397427 [Suillus cothurnatus]